VIIQRDKLQIAANYEINLSEYSIQGSDIIGDPALLRGEKEPLKGNSFKYVLFLQHSGKASFFTAEKCLTSLSLE
jgi:hypothetical protein